MRTKNARSKTVNRAGRRLTSEDRSIIQSERWSHPYTPQRELARNILNGFCCSLCGITFAQVYNFLRRYDAQSGTVRANGDRYADTV